MNTWDKIKELTSIVHNELKINPILTVSILGGTIVRLIAIIFSTYLIIWIQSFVNHKTYPITVEESKTIYSNIMVIAVLIGAVIFPFVGTICDYYSPKYIIPISFFFRAIVSLMFLAVDNPT